MSYLERTKIRLESNLQSLGESMGGITVTAFRLHLPLSFWVRMRGDNVYPECCAFC